MTTTRRTERLHGSTWTWRAVTLNEQADELTRPSFQSFDSIEHMSPVPRWSNFVGPTWNGRLVFASGSVGNVHLMAFKNEIDVTAGGMNEGIRTLLCSDSLNEARAIPWRSRFIIVSPVCESSPWNATIIDEKETLDTFAHVYLLRHSCRSTMSDD